MTLGYLSDPNCSNNIKASPYAYGHILTSEPPMHMQYGFGKELLDTLCNRCDKLPTCMHSHELYEVIQQDLIRNQKQNATTTNQSTCIH